jgi:hypothetical protein
MKSFIAAAVALLATSVTAVPLTARQPPDITFSLINDLSGASLQSTIPADSNIHSFADLFGSNTPILASSAQLVNFPQGLFCCITDASGKVLARLNFMQTFVDLDGNPNKAIPQDLSADGIQCEL